MNENVGAESIEDPITELFVDKEAGREAFTYVLQSGRTGTVHVEQVLEYNQDPTYLRDLLLYRLTLEAQKRVAESPLSKREIVRRLGTSAAQLYRLLDQTNDRSPSTRSWHYCRCSIVTLISSSGRRPPDTYSGQAPSSITRRARLASTAQPPAVRLERRLNPCSIFWRED